MMPLDLMDTNLWTDESDHAFHMLYKLSGAVKLFMQQAAVVL